jgi:hypothetical protein
MPQTVSKRLIHSLLEEKCFLPNLERVKIYAGLLVIRKSIRTKWVSRVKKKVTWDLDESGEDTIEDPDYQDPMFYLGCDMSSVRV